MVQDSDPFGFSAAATDLLDTPGSPFSLVKACDDTNPCLQTFVLQGNNPDFSCKSGMCQDPLQPTASGVNINIPVGNPGGVAGTQIRFVFDKVLNSSFEAVAIDPAKLPGVDKTYKLMAGLAELDGPDGMPIPQATTCSASTGCSHWDPTGSPTNTSDPIRSPYGPAIVIKPAVILAPNVTYTLKLTSSMVTDRKGNPMADQNGQVVSGTYTKTFKTENLRDISAAFGAVDITSNPTLKPDEVVQIAFNTGIDELTFQQVTPTVACEVKLGNTPVTVLAYAARGDDPTMCSAPSMGMIGAPNDDTILNIFPVDQNADASTAAPAAGGWAAGSYTIHCTGKDDSYGMGSITLDGTFTVAGTAGGAKDPLSVDNNVLPSQCTGM